MIQIVIHCLPQEIDQLEQTLIQLKRNSTKFETTKDKFGVNVNLNLNLCDWHNSKLKEDFFIRKFQNLEQLTSTWAATKFDFLNSNILGCVSHRREVFNNNPLSDFLILDTDMIFSENLLWYMWNSHLQIKDHYENYIITPQIPKGWDSSWDCLVNEEYLNRSDREYQTRDPYQYGLTLGEVTVEPIDQFKFGGGWGTLISSNLAKEIPIPSSFGHYGLEDTYIMNCCNILRQNGGEVIQFVLKNEIICEDHIFRFNPYKDYLVTENRAKEFLQIAESNFQKELNNFLGKYR